jgi:hypothetical protein
MEFLSKTQTLNPKPQTFPGGSRGEEGSLHLILDSLHWCLLSAQGTDTAMMIKDPDDGNYATAFVRQFRQEYVFFPGILSLSLNQS